MFHLISPQKEDFEQIINLYNTLENSKTDNVLELIKKILYKKYPRRENIVFFQIKKFKEYLNKIKKEQKWIKHL